MDLLHVKSFEMIRRPIFERYDLPTFLCIIVNVTHLRIK